MTQLPINAASLPTAATPIPNAASPQANSPANNFQAATAASQQSALEKLDLESFLELLITELQNQDPLNPMDNTQLLNQLSQIRQIGATTQLSDTLNGVAEGQNLTTASNMIGRQISALTEDGDEVEGLVDRVSLETADNGRRTVQIHVGDQAVPLRNVREVAPPANALGLTG